MLTWTARLTDAANCAALYPPNESQEGYQYSKVACNSPQTYICSKPVQDYFRQEKLQSRKATLTEISLSLQLSKESLESAKASLAAQENSEEVKNSTKTYIEAAKSDIETSAENITEELGKQQLSISTVSQTAQFITDNINGILRKLSEDKLLQVITTLDNLKTKLEKQKKDISDIKVVNDNQESDIDEILNIEDYTEDDDESEKVTKTDIVSEIQEKSTELPKPRPTSIKSTTVPETNKKATTESNKINENKFSSVSKHLHSLRKRVEKLETKILTCCNKTLEWLSEITASIAVILSLISISLQIYLTLCKKRAQSELNTRVFFQVRRH
jgi:hypothetical protein